MSLLINDTKYFTLLSTLNEKFNINQIKELENYCSIRNDGMFEYAELLNILINKPNN